MSEHKPTNKPPEPQVTCDSVSSSQPSKKHKADRPLAEPNTRFERVMTGFAPLVSVDAPGGGNWIAPAYTNVPERVSVKKNASSFHVSAQANLTFTLTTFNGRYMETPIKLFRLDEVKSKREYTTGHWSQCVGGGGTFVQFSCQGFVADAGLPVTVTNPTESSRQIMISAPLQPGEYALEFGYLVFTFGVD
ncbi:MAG: hypothetical protein ACLQHF_06680 [Terracidiphilus sp.]